MTKKTNSLYFYFSSHLQFLFVIFVFIPMICFYLIIIKRNTDVALISGFFAFVVIHFSFLCILLFSFLLLFLCPHGLWGKKYAKKNDVKDNEAKDDYVT